jgi:uncharacterized membrane protein YfcA
LSKAAICDGLSQRRSERNRVESGVALSGLVFLDAADDDSLVGAGDHALDVVALMAPVATLVAPYGARLAHALSPRRLETAFGLYLIAVAIRFLISLF